MSRFRDLTGQKFGRLQAIKWVGTLPKKKGAIWLCQCSCGRTSVVISYNLTRGCTKSCGCLAKERQRESNKTHGMKSTPTYNSYIAAKQRCENPNNIGFKNYGGRGIKFLFTSFEQFFAELGMRPEGMSVDRIDNEGPYAPGNVRWATKAQQLDNRRPIGKLTKQNVIEIRKRAQSETQVSLAKEFDVSTTTISTAVNRLTFRKVA